MIKTKPPAVTAAVLALAIAAAPDAAHAEDTTHVSVAGSMSLADHDGDDDFQRGRQAFSGKSRIATGRFMSGVRRDRCFPSSCAEFVLAPPKYHVAGGAYEVRGELTVTAQRFAFAPGWVRVDIDARLYEGTDRFSGDLDGRREFQIWKPPGTRADFDFRVRNEDEGGDYVDFRFVIRAIL